ncbi:MAG: choloylglycine hydrolase [Clostridia bacterium]|nr:choloylglycine hydrolase [Clostridia bacterium]
MCTAISYRTKDHYFGRNLDIERGYGERVVITPRNFRLDFRHVGSLSSHYAMIGMAAVIGGYPLYFEATNEKGISMAGLNFPKNAFYGDYAVGKQNIAPFELVPYLLGKCGDFCEVREALESVNVANISFREDLPVTPLHWLISDGEGSLTLECTREGMKLYDNPFGVLTNNPPFPFHVSNVEHYMALHAGLADNKMSARLALDNHSLGLGAFGLPGDFSSSSRFVRAVFVKESSFSGDAETESVNQFFHILSSVAMPKGCLLTAGGEYEYTRYSCCCNTDTQVYYYTTYEDCSVRRVDMHAVDLSGEAIYMKEEKYE